MDLNDLWQEHKRFLSIAGAGLALFLIAYFVIDGRFTAERRSLDGTLRSNLKSLGEERFGQAELEAALAGNELLDAAVSRLARAAVFETRPRFQFDPSGDSTQYFVLHAQIAQELTTLASKQRVILPPGLDLEAPETAQAERIERHLAALDLVDRVLRLAIQERVKRVHAIRVQLDPALNSRDGVGEIETTRVEFEFRSPAAPIVGLIAASQSDVYEKPLTIADVEMVGAKSKEDEITAKITFAVLRLHGEWVAEALALAPEQGQ